MTKKKTSAIAAAFAVFAAICVAFGLLLARTAEKGLAAAEERGWQEYGYTDETADPAVRREFGGILVNFDGVGATYRYKNLIKTDALADGFIDFMILPDEEGEQSAGKFLLTLTDAYDETQQLSLYIYAGSIYGEPRVYVTAALTDEVDADGMIGQSKTWGLCLDEAINSGTYCTYGTMLDDKHFPLFGYGNCSWRGQTFRAYGTMPFRFAYSNGVVSGYSYLKENVNFVNIADIRSADYLSKSSAGITDGELLARYDAEHVQNLFSSGRISLSLKLLESEGGADILITKVGDQDISETHSFANTTTPLILLEEQPLHYGIANKSFRLPAADVYEYGDVNAKREYFVRVTDASGEEVSNDGASFLPEKAGLYTAEYISVGGTNGETEDQYTISVLDIPAAPQIDVAWDAREFVLGESIVLPAANIADALTGKDVSSSGKIHVIASGCTLQVFEDVSVGHEFTLDRAGNWTIVYQYVNEYGVAFDKRFTFTVAEEDIFIQAVGFETSLCVGEKFDLFASYAWADGRKQRVDYTIAAPSGETFSPKGRYFIPEYTGQYRFTLRFGTAEIERTLSVLGANGDLFSFTSDLKGEIIPDVDFESWSVDGNGVMLTSQTSGVSARYNRAINLNFYEFDPEANLPEQAIFEFQRYTGAPYSGRAGRYTLKLIDANDASNSLQIDINQHRDGDDRYSYINICYNNVYFAFSAEHDPNGELIYTELYGAPVLASMNSGNFFNGMDTFKFAYDKDDKSVYVCLNGANGINDWWEVMDFDDPEMVGFGNEWSGFSSDEIYLEFSFSISERTAVVVSRIAGREIGGLTVNDEEAPSLVFKEGNTFSAKEGALPSGAKGQNYRLPAAEAYDLFDADAVLDTAIYGPKSDENLFSSVKDGIFVPQESGTYTVKYTLSDYSGNITEYIYTLEVFDDYPPMSASWQEKTAVAGGYFSLPQIVCQGGSGNIVFDFSVSLNGEALDVEENGEVFLPQAGVLRAEVVMSDYSGRIQTQTLSLEVLAPDTPVLSIEKVPVTAIGGSVLQLYDFNAAIYGADGTVGNADRFIEIDGTEVYKNVGGVVTGGLQYNVPEDASVLKITYKAAADGENRTAEESIYVPVIRPKEVYDWLIPFKNDRSSENDFYDVPVSARYKLSQDGYSAQTALTFAGNGGVVTANPVSTESLSISFAFEDAETFARFGRITFTLTNFENRGESVSFSIEKSGADALVRVSGGSKIVESADENGFTFHFVYDNDAKALTLASGSTVCLFTLTDGGRRFEGFGSESVIMTIAAELNETGEAEIILMQLGEQSFSASHWEGNYSYLTAAPTLTLYGKYENENYLLGEEFSVFSASAYGLLIEHADITVTVVSPSGKTVCSGAASGKTLTAEEYGEYTITYAARYTSGGGAETATTYLSYTVKVRHYETPTIALQGEPAGKGRIGQSYTVPAASASAVYGEANIQVLFIAPDGAYIDVTGMESFSFDGAHSKVGRWRLVYLAKDIFYNTARTEYLVDVTE